MLTIVIGLLAQPIVGAEPLSNGYFKDKDPYRFILGPADTADALFGVKTPVRDVAPTTLVQPWVEPFWGIKSDKAIASPTKVAATGLLRLLAGDQPAALAHAKWLLDNADRKAGALLFPHRYDFAPVYPYIVRAPWSSGLTQGLALTLFSQLYKSTRDPVWKQRSADVFASYGLTISQGGFTRATPQGPWFEEYPSEESTAVFNGAAVAALALVEYADLCSAPEARRLFERSIPPFESAVPKLELLSAASPYRQSAYGLAKSRPELLFRLTNLRGDVWVANAELLTGKGEPAIASVHPGRPNDDDTSATGYLWLDRRSQTWGERTSHQGESCRNANGNPSGEYRHAPFSLVLPTQVLPVAPPASEAPTFHLTIDYLAKPGAFCAVQIYDGTEYHAITRLEGANKPGWQSGDFPLPSLALERLMRAGADQVLIRFVGANRDIWVSRLAFVAKSRYQPYTVEVGVAGDADRNAGLAYVWSDPQSMTWGEPEQQAGRPCRNIVGAPAGALRHAPVTFPLRPEPTYRVRLRLAVSQNSAATFEVYDGANYLPLARSAGGARAHSFTDVIAGVPDAVVAAARQKVRRRAAEPKYFDDNWELLALLAEHGKSPALRKIADAWQEPWPQMIGDSRWLNRVNLDAKGFPFRPLGDGPILGREWPSVAYPSLVQGEGSPRLYFGVVGADQSERIYWAESPTFAGPWRPVGPVTVAGADRVAFPELVYRPAMHAYALYYCTRAAPDKPHDKLCVAHSPTGVQFADARVVYEGPCRDPAVWTTDTGAEFVFFLATDSKSGASLRLLLGDGQGNYSADRVLDAVGRADSLTVAPLGDSTLLVFQEDATGLYVGSFDLREKAYHRWGHVLHPAIGGHPFGFDVHRDRTGVLHIVGARARQPNPTSPLWRFQFDPKALSPLFHDQQLRLDEINRALAR